MKINKEEHQQVIKEFLSTFKGKVPVLTELSRPHVYKCSNANQDPLKHQQLLAKLFESEDLHRQFRGIDEERAFLDVIQEIENYSPRIFLGRNYVTADKDEMTAIKRLRAFNPSRDWNMFEINKVKDYFIVWD